MTAFVISSCTGKPACSIGAPISFQAIGLPWFSVLLSGTPPLDEIKGVEIQARCGALLTTFTGTLNPEVKGFGGLKFGPTSGTLENPLKEKPALNETDKLIGPAPKSKIGAI